SAKLWSKVMGKVHDRLDPIDFKKASNIEFYNINLLNGSIVPKGAYNSGMAAFIKGHIPTTHSSYTPPPETTTPPAEEENKPETET
ncbi:hypothetical protein L0M92_13350, partial [Casaltella massiliensis]|nr:hypothetical protein [Casaltella massiliensis]